ncbi:2-haloacid dehalogenase [Cnuella takakiae]|uniref:2-haloacid dehalogenase n=1 Tax=Cnuella takakiae TaxID=1302690 RepID=A0A1M5IWY3_9BACT|nr:haloacid dehalogenase type II [Cnuella takakiae]OLY91429.1 haloacid dehalogenase, type II [Cnuella takakiae]SHG32806.1 2-haloacid dehalogenase [Cnuella takakiae]
MSVSSSRHRPQYILFDVYDTLLDMTEIKRRINSALDNKRGYDLWFSLLTQYCFLHNCTATFQPFTDVCKATLQMAGAQLGVQVSEGHIEDLLHLMKYLPLQDGTPQVLSDLYDAGFRLAALTNAPKDVVRERMERTGLISYFDPVLSSEKIRQYKPATRVYQWAAEQCGVPAAACMLVSTHDWDILGAHNAGMQTAYIERPQQLAYPLGPKPGICLQHLNQLLQQIG